MFTGFKDRIEILSRGVLPPKQTIEGFYAGESVPVNEALSKIFIQLHITEHTGRGIPKITSVYGKENVKIKENNILVTIPYNRLELAEYGTTNVPVDVPVDASVGASNIITDKVKLVLEFCRKPRGILEIADYLGYKDKRSVRRILNPLLEEGRIAMTVPDKPNSSLQKYITIS